MIDTHWLHSAFAGLLLVSLAGCATVVPDPAEPVDGTYRFTLSRDEAENGPSEFRDAASLAWFPLTHTVTLEDGVYRLKWQTPEESGTVRPGTFSAEDGTLEIDGFDDNGRPFHWRLGYAVTSDGDLVVTPEPGMDEGDAFVFTTHPWERID